MSDHNTDYNYDRHRASLAGERSQNGVQDLAGYDASLDLQPDPTWPGLDPDPKKIVLDRATLESALHELEGLIAPLRDPRLFTQITQLSAEAKFGPSNWHAAQFLKDATNQVGRSLSDYGLQLVNNIDTAIDAIYRALSGSTSADATNKQAFSGLEASLGTPAAGTTPSGASANPTNVN